MDIHQLRSWIFELYEPLENARQYLVFDRERGNLLVDAPPMSERALRLVRGIGRSSLLVVTNRERARDAAAWRDALGVQVAAHRDDAGVIDGGADITLEDEGTLRPDARTLRVREGGEGATVVVLRREGGVLLCGDLDLASPAARALLPVDFSVVLSASRSPIWNAGKDLLHQLLNDPLKPRRQFGILLPSPWDRGYAGRLEDQMKPNALIPTDQTAEREAAMGPTTLVVSRVTPDKQARAPRPANE
ncbi:MAG TPA: hypothetical protein VFW12_02780 [Candidatus Limnocylindria bacterium]|nr:hypothetical protein [Candidatus Limnocylindria bacterium]